MLHKYQLSNGMNVILAQSKKSPVISTQVWVKNGSADEQRGEEGVSHFIEHLLFKGTEKYKVGEIAQEVESAGGHLNAYTSFDQTVYYMTLSREYLEKSMDMLSQMIGYPLFDEDEIDNEREVVIEEIKRGRDNPGRVASRNMFETIYKKHPYKRPVIGYDSVVKKISPKKIKEYFYTRYSPKNMFLLLVGDFEKPEAKKLIKKYFEKIRADKVSKRKRIKEPKQERPRQRVLQTEFNNTYCYISWPIPHVKHKDVNALDLLSMVLGFGESSLLSAKLRNELAVANSVACSTYTPLDQGLFSISSVTQPEKLFSYLQALVNVLKDDLSTVFKNEEIHKAITALESHEFFGMETVDGLASKYGNYQFLLGDPTYFKQYLKEIRALGPEELLKVFKKYLKPEKMNISISTNLDKKEVEKEIKAFKKAYKEFFNTIKKIKPEKRKALKRLPKLQTTGKTVRAKKINIAKGVDLISLPSFETATISIQLATQGGTRYESIENNGVYGIIADSLLAGSQTLSERELAAKLESKAIYIGGFSGRNSYGIKLSCLSHCFEEGMSTMMEQWLNPKFEEAALEREVAMSIEHLKALADRPSQVAFQNMMKAMYKNHPYSLESIGTEKSLKNITKKLCLDIHKEQLETGKVVISAVGNYDEQALVKYLKSAYKKQTRKGDFHWNQHALTLIDKNEEVREKLPKEQSHIFLGYQGLDFSSKDRYSLKLLESLLSGQGGRLFVELRDKASLAYTVSPIRMDGLEKGYFGSYIGCSPEKEEKAIKMMFAEFDKLCNDFVPEEELQRARQNLIGRFDIQMQKNSSIAAKMLFDELYGLGFDEKDRNTNSIKQVNKEEVRELARKLFGQKHILSVVEGLAK
jgi:zinc protease